LESALRELGNPRILGLPARADRAILPATTIRDEGRAMFARTSVWSGSSEDLARWADHVSANVGPMVEGLPGNAGVFFFIDRSVGRALTLTLWRSETAALASDDAAERSREKTVDATGVQLLERGRWEPASGV
jgi:hypothetical protein